MTQKSHHDSAVLAKGQQVITACAFIWRMRRSEVQILLAKRADTKKFLPGMYELPGGHIEFGEEIREGLAREILEELQVEVSIGDPFYVYGSGDDTGEHCTFKYRIPSGDCVYSLPVYQ